VEEIQLPKLHMEQEGERKYAEEMENKEKNRSIYISEGENTKNNQTGKGMNLQGQSSLDQSKIELQGDKNKFRQDEIQEKNNKFEQEARNKEEINFLEGKAKNIESEERKPKMAGIATERKEEKLKKEKVGEPSVKKTTRLEDEEKKAKAKPAEKNEEKENENVKLKHQSEATRREEEENKIIQEINRKKRAEEQEEIEKRKRIAEEKASKEQREQLEREEAVLKMIAESDKIERELEKVQSTKERRQNEADDHWATSPKPAERKRKEIKKSQVAETGVSPKEVANMKTEYASPVATVPDFSATDIQQQLQHSQVYSTEHTKPQSRWSDDLRRETTDPPKSKFQGSQEPSVYEAPKDLGSNAKLQSSLPAQSQARAAGYTETSYHYKPPMSPVTTAALEAGQKDSSRSPVSFDAARNRKSSGGGSGGIDFNYHHRETVEKSLQTSHNLMSIVTGSLGPSRPEPVGAAVSGRPPVAGGPRHDTSLTSRTRVITPDAKQAAAVASASSRGGTGGMKKNHMRHLCFGFPEIYQ
jgi:hypothetical protein